LKLQVVMKRKAFTGRFDSFSCLRLNIPDFGLLFSIDFRFTHFKKLVWPFSYDGTFYFCRFALTFYTLSSISWTRKQLRSLIKYQILTVVRYKFWSFGHLKIKLSKIARMSLQTDLNLWFLMPKCIMQVAIVLPPWSA